MPETNFYIRTGASNLNAGSTNADAADLSYPSGTFVRSNGMFTVAAGNPLTDGVSTGSFASIYTNNSGIAGVVARVTGVTASTIGVSLTALAGATTSVSEAAADSSLRIGGAWAGPSGILRFPVGFVNNAITNISGHPVAVNFDSGIWSIRTGLTGNNAGPITWRGAGDFLTMISGGNDTWPFTPMTASAAAQTFEKLWFHGCGTGVGAGVGPSMMFDILSTNIHLYRCAFSNSWRNAVMVNGAGNASAAVVEQCLAWDYNIDDASDMGGFSVSEESVLLNCIALRSSTLDVGGGDACGFVINGSAGEPVTLIGCISTRNNKHGYQINSVTPVTMINCVASKNADNGVALITPTIASSLRISNSIFEKNGIFGIGTSIPANSSAMRIDNCYFFNNPTHIYTGINPSRISNTGILTESPFVDSELDNFNLKTTGEALSLYNASPVRYLLPPTGGAPMISYFDIGAIQASGGVAPTPVRLRRL